MSYELTAKDFERMKDATDRIQAARVEELARELYAVEPPKDVGPFFGWDLIRDDIRDYFRELARVAIAHTRPDA